jgi:hypothetical protein
MPLPLLAEALAVGTWLSWRCPGVQIRASTPRSGRSMARDRMVNAAGCASNGDERCSNV